MASIFVRLFGEDVTASKSLEHFAVVAEKTSKGIGKQFGDMPKYAAAATAGVVAVSVKMATDFQSQMSLLSSAAGEPVVKVRAIGDGVKSIAVETGVPLAQLTEGAYVVAKSFGKDGAAGQLDILRAAAQGATAEHVDLATATNALTSVMKGYNIPAGMAVATQNQLIAASGLAKTTMQDFAGSLSSVVPLASALHVSFAQVGGAIATMTQHGETADNATQNLSNLLTNLAGQNNVASKAMQQLGINTIDLQQHLGQRGITGTLKIVEDALAKSSHGGMVVVNSFRQSANATASLNTMLAHMTPQARSLSQEWEKGDITYKTYIKSMKGLGEQSFIQSSQFKGLFDASQGFNESLKSGNPNISTAATQLQHMLGGVTGMRTALMLGGTSARGFSDAVKEIGAAGEKNGHDISTWAITSKNASVQFDKLRESMAVVGVSIGTVLLPPLMAAAGVLAGFFGGISKGAPVATGVAIAIGVLTAAFTGLFLIQKAFALQETAIRGAMALSTIATKVWSAANFVATGQLYELISAKVADAAETAALAGMYAKDFVAGLLASGGAMVAQTAQTVAGTAAFVAQRTVMVVGTAVTWLATAATTAFGVAIDIATGPVGLIILAVGALIAVVVLLVTHWKDVCGFLQTVWGGIAKWFGDTLTSIGKWWSDTWAGIEKIFGVVLAAVVSAFTHWTLLGIIVSHWSQIMSATKTAWDAVTSFIGGIPGKIIGFFVGIDRWLYQAGMNLLQGLINGIQAEVGAVSSMVGSVASNVIGTFKNLLGIHSPSTVFVTLGRFVTQGLQLGIQAGATGVRSAMTTVSNDLVNAFTKLGDQRATAQKRLAALEQQEQIALLQRPILHVTSHGKVTAAAEASYQREMAIWELRLSGIRSKVADEKSLLDSITKAQSGSTRTRLTSLLSRDTVELTALAAKRTSLTAQIKTATTDLDAALKTRNSYATSVTSGVMGMADITSVKGQQVTDASGATTTAAVTSADILASMQSQLSKATQFTADVAKLQSEGLNQTAYKQLVDAFSSNGDLSTAEGLLGGGQAAVTQLNSLQTQLLSSATSLGTSSSTALYQAGVNAAQGIVSGLQSQEDAIGVQMAKIGTGLAASFKKALGIKSPSTVMAGHGVNVVQGVIVGMRSQQDAARSTISELFGGARPGATGAAYSGGAGGVSVGQINVTSGASAQEIVSELSWAARVYGR
ncbi:MAG: phage tail tape measure protein [Acidobacteria bacterium]|nr:phage tail tape measure protein [Acidobacteriota bacterium]